MVSKEAAGRQYREHFVSSCGYARLLELTQGKDTAHENVVRFLDFCEGPDSFFVVRSPNAEGAKQSHIRVRD